MIIYVGNEIEGAWARDVADVNGMDFTVVESSIHIHSQLNTILALSNGCKYVIYDLAQYVDTAEEIAKVINAIYKANQAMPIAVCGENFLPNSSLATCLYNCNIKNIIFAWTQGEKKEELELCIKGQMESVIDVKMEGFSTTPKADNNNQSTKDKSSIGVAGSLHRIGTTTQALQLVKYLEINGKRACYIEMNNTGFVGEIQSWFNTDEENEYLGKVSFNGVDMFHKKEMIPEILKEPYDYFVYDYGVYNDKEFNRTSFLEKDLRVFVLGSAPSEMGASHDIIKSAFYKDIEYIFNLVPIGEQEDILDMMEEKSNRTHFGEYAPDPFILGNSEIYDSLLHLTGKKEHKKQTKKKPFWRR